MTPIETSQQWHFAATLVAVRDVNGWTQAELAAECHESPSRVTISRWENMAQRPTRAFELRQLREATKLSHAQLRGDEPLPPVLRPAYEHALGVLGHKKTAPRRGGGLPATHREAFTRTASKEGKG